jgi:imidazole glycerol-phosphate synthase subunit HisH
MSQLCEMMTQMKVGVIDYGVGNLGSVVRSLEELRVSPVLITKVREMQTVDSLILPGVGNFADCARRLNVNGWTSALRDEVLAEGKPILGVCLGMQLLASSSTEGLSDANPDGVEGLGFIPGRVVHLSALGCSLRVPQVGWNDVKHHLRKDELFEGIPDGSDFYFVHSYAFVPSNPEHVVATCEYGITITAAVRSGHVWGTQFHPEKSSRAGFRLLRNFIESAKC